jgi:phosphoribosylamine---glycine ligase
MNILLLGSGGREHALAYKIKLSPKCSKLYIAPGNGGTKECGENVQLSITDFPAIQSFCIDKKIEMIVVGPEKPAVEGIYDYFLTAMPKLMVISASMEGAKLEGSKAYAKKFMQEFQIPTADYIEVNAGNFEKGIAFLESQKPPYVLKADGLAEGKGVVIAATLAEAKSTLSDFIHQKKFGASSENVVIEQFLSGLEFSIFVYTNGTEYVLLPNAKDYKRIGEGDKGLNTGGMGSISPVPFVDEDMIREVEDTVIKPTIAGLQKNKIAYQGFIYFGLIATEEAPMVIEYNCRLGDPETEVILPRLKSDLVDLFLSGCNHILHKYPVVIDDRSCATVILASGGYPEAYQKGKLITGLDKVTNSKVFHAGTLLEQNNHYTNGGRVFAVSSYGNTLDDALKNSYASIEKIKFDGMYCRKDIGFEFDLGWKKKVKDNIFLGVLISILSTSFFYWLIYSNINNGKMDIINFIDKSYRAKILQLSIIPNLGWFFGALKIDKEQIAKGVFYGMILAGVFIVYFWFF